jgi:hypothetical protein
MLENILDPSENQSSDEIKINSKIENNKESIKIIENNNTENKGKITKLKRKKM